MGVLITSGDRLGLRALGSGGRTALASYDQIIRTLAQSMSPAHVALFAEPSLRGGAIDWFTNFDDDGKPARLNESAPVVREAARARLEGLVNDILEKAGVLQQSDREGDRVLRRNAAVRPTRSPLKTPSGWSTATRAHLLGPCSRSGPTDRKSTETLISDARKLGGRLRRRCRANGSPLRRGPAVVAKTGARRSGGPSRRRALGDLCRVLLTIGVTLLHACGLGFAAA